MTTIAYRDGIIAYDSQITAGDMIVDEAFDKHLIVDGVHYFLSGPTSDYEHAVKAYQAWKNVSEYKVERKSVSAIVWDQEIRKLCKVGYDSEGSEWFMSDITEEYTAFGSGSEYAMGAMAMGSSAKEAVECATKHDIYSGGMVRVFEAWSPGGESSQSFVRNHAAGDKVS